MKNQEYIAQTKEKYKNEKIAKYYKNAYSSKLGLRNLQIKTISVREQKIVKDYVLFLKQKGLLGETVLDIPVGTGKMTHIFLENNLKVTSADISKEMMAQIDSELKDHENYIAEEVADASSMSFEDNSFDLVANIRLLHRVDAETRRKIIKEAKRVSRGYCIISFAKSNAWHELRFKLKGKSSSPGREKLSVIKKELEEEGFKMIKKKAVLPIFSNEIIFLLRL